MTTAMMITSSPEDLNNLKITRDIISAIKNLVINKNDTLYSDNTGLEITKEEIEHVDEYFSIMYNFLLNPGMTEEQFLDYEKETD